MAGNKIKLGISQGDFNGISYEVIIKTLLDSRIFNICTPIIYGSPKVTAYHRKALNIKSFSVNIIQSADEANSKRVNLINCLKDDIRVELGRSTKMAGEASVTSLTAAVDDLKEGKIDALVTAPITKHNIQSDLFPFTGHTEYLKSVFNAGEVLMLMVNAMMRIGVVTGHVPLASVPSLLSAENIISKMSLLNESLEQDFAVPKGRIAVLSLNPHAGENGLLGDEEEKIIIPAIEQARDQGILVFGPFPSDGFFGSGDFHKFDAILAMYHDQGLTPFKTLAENDGVNYTAGLPVVRTSPAHGTALEIAGKDLAKPGSFRNAIYLAYDIFHNRTQFAEIRKNPLDSKIRTGGGNSDH